MAWRLDVICEDGPVYVESARHLEAGRFEQAFTTGNLRLNVFTAVLMLLHRLGLDWTTAGEAWGVLTSSLVVLPLFGGPLTSIRRARRAHTSRAFDCSM